MQITESKMLEMAGTIMAGAMANPANQVSMADTYSKQNMFVSVLTALPAALMQIGVSIVADDDQGQINVT